MALLWIGTGSLALNLRLGVASVPPILPELRVRLHLSSAAEALLTSLPVLCFGLFSGLAAPAARRFGAERVIGAAIALLAGALVLRATGPIPVLYLGTVVMGGAIALMNVLLSGVIKRREPARAGVLLGTYLVSLSAGAMAASALSVPVLQSTGSTRIALGIWALPATIGLLGWLPQLRVPKVAVAERDHVPGMGLARRALAWQVTGFMGLQSLTYFSVLSWLPTMLRSRGLGAASAGVVVSLLAAGSAFASFLLPWMAGRRSDHRSLIPPVMVSCLIGILGLLAAPIWSSYAFALLLGAGQGACLSLALFFVIARSPTPGVAASLSGMAQGVGYTVSATGPLGMGLIHAATDNWWAAFGFVLALTLVEWRVASLAARPLVLELPEAATADGRPVVSTS